MSILETAWLLFSGTFWFTLGALCVLAGTIAAAAAVFGACWLVVVCVRRLAA